MKNRRQFFGTDGIRGRVGTTPITPEFFLKLGWATGQLLRTEARGKVIIGKDTRLSGYMLEAALSAGFSSAGLDVWLTGPMPTPAIAYLTRTFRAQVGVVISASHNPYHDNGVKFFCDQGLKFADQLEFKIEEQLDKPLVCVDPYQFGKAHRISDAAGRYIEFCKATFPSQLNLSNLKIVLDCAHGASYHIAPNVFRELGAEVQAIGCSPDGHNINAGCGATDTVLLSETVQATQADLGIALDGDGDRLIMIDHTGTPVMGDQLLYIIVRQAILEGRFEGGVVGTVMSNLGLERALKALNVPFQRVAVGDRYILQELRARNWHWGGENSGHILLLEETTTGDGIIAALQVLNALVKQKRSLRSYAQEIPLLPQALRSVSLNEDVACSQATFKRLEQAAQKAQQAFGSDGRVLLRRSGTEALLRIMVEGEDQEKVSHIADQLLALTQ